MRVRAIHLRLLASVVALLWGAATIAVLVAYHPGVPVAPLVAATPIVGLGASLAALAWPPVVRSNRAAAAVGWLGILELLLLGPSVGDLITSLLQQSATPFLPSAEDAYGWFAALATAALFAGIGLSRRVLGPGSLRQARLGLALLLAVAMLGVGSGISGVAALATALAYAPRAATTLAAATPPATGSAPATSAAPPTPAASAVTAASGPAAHSEGGSRTAGATTNPRASAAIVLPPSCTEPVQPVANATVTETASSRVDGREIGSIDLAGVRSGQLERWTATLSGWPVEQAGEPSRLAYVRTRSGAWLSSDGGGWVSEPLDEEIVPYVPIGATPAPDIVRARQTLDTEVIEVALAGGARLAAEDVGLEVIGNATARHCRLLTGGSIATQAFRPLRWLLGQAPLANGESIADWRGNLDWWVLDNGTLAMASVSVQGLVPGGWPSGLQAVLQATLTVRPLSSAPVIQAPPA